MPDAILYALTHNSILHCICAQRVLQPSSAWRLDVLLYSPGRPAAVSDSLYAYAFNLKDTFPEIRNVISVSETEMKPLFESQNMQAACRGMRELLHLHGKPPEYDAIFYQHDVICNTAGLLANSFPEAQTVCLGDAHGLFWTRTSRLGLLGLAPWTTPLFSSPDMKPDRYAAVLPAECAPGLLDESPLTVLPRAAYLKVLQQAREGMPKLRELEQDLLERYARPGRPLFLLLTETLAEAEFISEEQDIDHYAVTLLRNTSDGDVVLIKPHPLESFSRLEALQKRLHDRLTLVGIEGAMNRVPVELWRELAPACTVFCNSSPLVSLNWLHGCNVVTSMDETFIDSQFAGRLRNPLHFAATRNALTLQNLQTWDQRGPVTRFDEVRQALARQGRHFLDDIQCMKAVA